MSAPKGHKKWGGRSKGTPNKNKELLSERANALGVDPFDILLYFAAGNYKALELDKKDLTASMRLNAASSACKYLYPQKRPTDIPDTDDEGFKVILEDYSSKK